MRSMPPAQRLQCRRFLAELRRTGNVAMAADRVGIATQTFQRRRRRHPAFATQWAAALSFAQATLARSGPLVPEASGAKTSGGEYSVRAGKNGEWQVRRAQPGSLSEKGEAMFLAELAKTCNVALACAVVGITKSNIYKRRQRSDQFADRMDAALAWGHERLEFAVMEAARCSLGPEEMAAGWLELGATAPPPLTIMSFDQVISAMGMHMKRVALGSKRRAHNEHVTTAEETDAEIIRLLDRLDKRKVAIERLEQREAAAMIEEAPRDDRADLALAAPEERAAVPEAAGRTVGVRVLK